MKRYFKASILVLSCALMGIATLLFLEEACLAKTFNAVLNVMAYDREVTIEINGVHITKIEGGKSEAIRLFLANDTSVNNLPSEMRQSMQQLFCLKEGDNTIEISFRPKKGSDPQSQFRVTIESGNYQVPVLEYVKGPRFKEDSVKGTFQIFTQEPAGFKTAVMK